MTDVINFYIDDSGTRHPDRKPGKRADHGYDWFALGGILVQQEEEHIVRTLHSNFCAKWNIDYPLHSVEIRSQTEHFLWLRACCADEQNAFYEELYQMMRDAPVVGLACTIDRPGYNERYRERYAEKRWALCKTAFNIAVERAVKYSRDRHRRLRVAPEWCNREEDANLKGYYEELKVKGTPFSPDRAVKYAPLTPENFRETLYEFKLKKKSSPLAQLADLYLWPICMGGYHASNRPYQRLMGDGKLIECHIPDGEEEYLGSKYSCFDLVQRKP